jgi:hypothetical protein
MRAPGPTLRNARQSENHFKKQQAATIWGAAPRPRGRRRDALPVEARAVTGQTIVDAVSIWSGAPPTLRVWNEQQARCVRSAISNLMRIGVHATNRQAAAGAHQCLAQRRSMRRDRLRTRSTTKQSRRKSAARRHQLAETLASASRRRVWRISASPARVRVEKLHALPAPKPPRGNRTPRVVAHFLPVRVRLVLAELKNVSSPATVAIRHHAFGRLALGITWAHRLRNLSDIGSITS